MQIRRFQVVDTQQIAQLFHDTIHRVNISDYTQAQVDAWAPANIHFVDWSKKCSDCLTWIAEIDGTIVGFGQLEPNGHIDCFYVHHAYQRCGVGRSIFSAIEDHARQLDCKHLYTEASITARPFFEQLGFELIADQEVSCRGEKLANYRLSKQL